MRTGSFWWAVTGATYQLLLHRPRGTPRFCKNERSVFSFPWDYNRRKPNVKSFILRNNSYCVTRVFLQFSFLVMEISLPNT